MHTGVTTTIYYGYKATYNFIFCLPPINWVQTSLQFSQVHLKTPRICVAWLLDAEGSVMASHSLKAEQSFIAFYRFMQVDNFWRLFLKHETCRMKRCWWKVTVLNLDLSEFPDNTFKDCRKTENLSIRFVFTASDKQFNSAKFLFITYLSNPPASFGVQRVQEHWALKSCDIVGHITTHHINAPECILFSLCIVLLLLFTSPKHDWT